MSWDDKTDELFVSYLMEPTKRPITGLDFASLYPHLIMTYNLSPEFIISKETCDGSFEKMRDVAVQAKKDDLDLHKIKFIYGGRDIIGYSVRHDNLGGDRFGVYPTLLKELYDKRSILKKPKLYYEMLKEHLEKLNDNVLQNNKIVKFLENNKINFDDESRIIPRWDDLIELEPAFAYAKELFDDPKETEKFELKKVVESITVNNAVKFIIKKLGMQESNENTDRIKQILNISSDRTGNLPDSVESSSDLTFDDIELYFAYYDSKQKALKVLMNSLYGESGNKISPFYILALAGGITSAGQYNLEFIANECKKLNCSVKYGDSVTRDTPVLIGNDDYHSYRNIEDLFIDRESTRKLDKEVYIPKNLYVWSDEGFTKIKKVIRHKTKKQLYRILTHTGSVDVTEDHSLLDADGEKIKPSECSIGTELLHKDLPTMNHKEDMISKKEAYCWGLFMADGSCGSYYYKKCSWKYTWAINNQNKDYLNKATKGMRNSIYCKKFKVLDTMKSSSVYKLSPNGNPEGMIKFMVEDFRNMFYYGRTKIVPTIILESSSKIRQAFFEGYYAGDGCKRERSKNFCLKGKIGAATMYKLCNSLGYQCSINSNMYKPDIYWLIITKRKFQKHPDKIKKIIKLPETENYVYDLETENHHFSAGIGRMTVSNTDSVYITVPEKSFEIIDNKYFGGKIKKIQYCTELVNITFTEIKKINKLINDKLIIDNGTQFLRLNYEEVLFPVVLISKKKYYGLPHISTPNFNTDRSPFTRGIEMKKRGVSNILKRVYGDKILTESLSIYNKKELMELVYDAIHYFYENKWELNDFVKTAIYKPKTIEEVLDGKGNKSVLEFVGRMISQDITVNPYERFKYIIAKKYPINYDYRGRKRPLKVGERMELLDRARQFNIEVDRDYYMNGNIITQLARVLIYRKEFQSISGRNKDATDEEIRKINEKMVKEAVKHLTGFIKQKGFYHQYQDVGIIKKAIFRKSESIIINKFSEMTGIDNVYVNFMFRDWDLDTSKSFKEIYKKTETKSIKQSANYGFDIIDLLVKIERKKSPSHRRNKRKIILHLRELYGDRNSKYTELYTDFKNRYVNKTENDFREIFKSMLKITTEYRDTLSIMANVIEKVIKPLLEQYYKSDNTLVGANNIDTYRGMDIDQICKHAWRGAKLDKKIKIPYKFLDELAEDVTYNLINNNNAIGIIDKMLDIQRELSYILSIYYQTISIQDAINAYNDRRNKTNAAVYDKPEIIRDHRNNLVNETCENIDVDLDII